MKIATVTPYDLSAHGGVNRYAFDVAAWLRTQGHDVRVIGPASSPSETPNDGTIAIGKPRTIRAGGTSLRIALDPRLYSKVRDLLDAEHFDIIHIHEPLLPIVPLAFLRHANAPTVGTFHASERVGRRIYRLTAPVLRRWAQRLDAQTAVSVAARDAAAPVLRDDVDIVPPGIDVAHFRRPLDRPPAMTGARHNVLFVGRAEPRKGLDVLIDAFSRVRQRLPDARLVIVGAMGARAAALQASVRAADRQDVVFAGPVDYADLPAYYQAADVFCAPARGGESFGIVLAEAMAAGTPIVASDIAGYRDVVRHDETGLLCAPGNVTALADAIVRVLQEPEPAAQRARNAAARVQQYDVAVLGRRLLALYDRLR